MDRILHELEMSISRFETTNIVYGREYNIYIS